MEDFQEKTGADGKNGAVLFGTGAGTSRPQSAAELAQFLNALPGGLLKCKNDADFTIMNINRGFLNLSGYAEADVRERLQNQFIRIVLPEDREKMFADIQKQLECNSFYETAYRIVRRDGSVIHVLDHGQLLGDAGRPDAISCELMDITMLHQTNEALRLSNERNQIVMDLVSDTIFEWDVQNQSLLYSSGRQKQRRIAAGTHSSPGQEPFLKQIHPEDRALFDDFLEKICQQSACYILDFRFLDPMGKLSWRRMRATCQCGSDGAPVKVIGVVTDINREYQIIQNLREKAERDSLTGLYDKMTAAALVEKELAGSPMCALHALLMIDIDNFKRLNDSMGHLFGDAILTEFAAAIKKELGAGNIVGRVGGDEFSVFLKNIPEKHCAEKAAQRILELLTVKFKNHKKNFHIACSIGIAFYPENGAAFHDLYQNADAALYAAKNSGKNKYAVYLPGMDL